MIRIPPHTDFIHWMKTKQYLSDSTAARREGYLRRLITLGTDLGTANIEEELIRTVPHYESMATGTRGDFRRALRYWQEYTRRDDRMIRTSPDTDFVLWIKTKQRVPGPAAARREGYLRRLITLGTDLGTANIEEELMKTVPHYETLSGQARREYRRALRYWQEYTREMAA